MSNYNQQQQAVILKGIAQQILSMNVPSFETVGKLFKEFAIDFEGNSTYSRMYQGIKFACSLSDDTKEDLKKDHKDLHHTISHFCFNSDGSYTQIRDKVFGIEKE